MGPVNVVREDPERPGLLFAGTEREVYVSFNDGDDWQSLRLNMPATSIRDLVIHDDDVVVGTHGRSIWILDDITPLRQVNANIVKAGSHLYKPQLATRVRWSMYSDTPLPPEEPAGKNPPDGAVIDYWLGSPAKEVKLEILDGKGTVIRSFSSSDEPESIDPNTLAYPTYWIRPPMVLSTTGGMHRFVWNLHYPNPEGVRRSHPISAVYMNTASVPKGPWVQPGRYTVRLTVDGKSSTQPLAVRLDPRVKVSANDLNLQFKNSMACFHAYQRAHAAREETEAVRSQLESLLKNESASSLKSQLTVWEQGVASISGGGRPGAADIAYSAVYAPRNRMETLAGSQAKFLYIMALLQTADARPTTQAIAAVKDQETVLKGVLNRWTSFKNKELKTANGMLKKLGLAPLKTN